MNLIEAIKAVPDHRHPRGIRPEVLNDRKKLPGLANKCIMTEL